MQPLLDYQSSRPRPTDQDAKRIIENMISKYHTNTNKLDLIVVILGGTTSAYKIVKTLGDLEYGIATQAVDEKNINRLSDQTVSNILLKINTKLGGRNFMLSANTKL